MTNLSEILPDVYGPITVKLDDRPDRFIRHLARIMGLPVSDVASMMLLERLEEEARLFCEVITPTDNTLSPDEIEAEAKKKVMEPLILDES